MVIGAGAVFDDACGDRADDDEVAFAGIDNSSIDRERVYGWLLYKVTNEAYQS